MFLSTNIEQCRLFIVIAVAAQIGIPRDHLQSEQELSELIGQKDPRTLTLMHAFLQKLEECESASASKMPADEYQKLSTQRDLARNDLIKRTDQLSKS